MNLIEAVKSGKPFKRRLYYLTLHVGVMCGENVLLKRIAPDELAPALTVADILATDWEIEEPKVTITREQLDVALSRVFSADGVYVRADRVRETLAKELGL